MSHFFNVHDSSLGRHVNAASRKNLLYRSQNQEPFWSENLYENLFSVALVHRESRESKLSVGSTVF